MGDIKAAFDRARVTAGDRAAKEATERAKGRPLPPRNEVLTDGSLEHAKQLQCLAPWVIVRVMGGSERRAKVSLERAGAEVFYPVGRTIRRLPQRMIPPKKRKGAKRFGILIVDVRNPYPGYVFCRPIGGEAWSANQRIGWATSLLPGLDGVVGTCMFGEELAMVSDWRVEMLRVAQDCGDYDRFDPLITIQEFNLAEFRYTSVAREHWRTMPRVVARLDSNRSTIHYVEEFGRITRIVAARGDQHISPIVDASAP